MSKVSVIVPIYNAEKYLHQCVDSILKQSYKDLEVVLCNDCSTDCSLAICQEYVQKDRRVRLINNEQNLGVYNNRLNSLNYLEGDYFFQVDADDWIDKDCIEIMVEKANEQNVDVVTVGFKRTLDKWGLFSTKGMEYPPGLYTEDDLKDYHHIFTQRIYSNNVCTKLIKTEVIKSSTLSFSDIHYGDDLLFLQQLSPHIHSVYVINDNKYYYRFGGSVTNVSPRFWEDQSKLYFLRKAYALEHEPDYVHGLTLFFIDILKDMLKLYLFFGKSDNRVAQAKAFLDCFYDTDDYREMIAVDSQSEFVELMRSKDTDGIIRYVDRHTSRLGVMKTKVINMVFKILSHL